MVVMMAWSSLGQFLFLLLMLPLNFVPNFGSAEGQGFSEFMDTSMMGAGR